jgi:hypothetical protein
VPTTEPGAAATPPAPWLDRGAGVRLLLVAGLLALAAYGLQERWQGAALPLLARVVDWIEPGDQTLALHVQRQDGEDYFERIATPDGRHVYATRAATGYFVQPLILAAGLLAAWPWRRRRELLFRCLLAAPWVVMATALDIPMMLCGFIRQQELEAFDQQSLPWLVTWADFMLAGGRYAVTAAGSAAAIALACQAARDEPGPARAARGGGTPPAGPRGR